MSVEKAIHKLKEALSISGIPGDATIMIESALRELNKVTPSTTISSFSNESRKEIPFGVHLGELSVEKGREAFKNTNQLIKHCIVDAPNKDTQILEGHCIEEVVKFPAVKNPSPSNPTDWEVKLSYCPIKSIQDRSIIAIPVDSLIGCELTRDNKLKFWYEHNGRGTITFVY